MSERLVIKNFGPIQEADISIKKMMVFIGESGSGKSVVLKLLSLFRWICKKLFIDDKYVFDDCETVLSQSGLLDFCINGSEITYFLGKDSCITISHQNGSCKLDCSQWKDGGGVTYEKVSFISEDRTILPQCLNREVRITRFPFHLEKTYGDLDDAIRGVFSQNSQERKIKIDVMNVEILEKKEGGANVYYLKDKENEVFFHNASSGMKSASMIEIITSFYVHSYKDVKKSLHEKLIFDTIQSYLARDDEISEELYDKITRIHSLSDLRYSLSFLIEEPELSLFPSAQKKLVDYLVALTFEKDKNIKTAFSTHSPYILTSLNCLLKAYQLANEFNDEGTRGQIKKIVEEKYWLNPDEFDAFIVKDGGIRSICEKENGGLILAEEIDGVSDEIGEIFDCLIDLEMKKRQDV